MVWKGLPEHNEQPGTLRDVMRAASRCQPAARAPSRFAGRADECRPLEAPGEAVVAYLGVETPGSPPTPHSLTYAPLSPKIPLLP